MAPPPELKTILCERISDGAVLLSYNTPKRSNAFDPQNYLDLKEGLVWARDEPDVKVVVITGKGKHYCAGQYPSRAMGGAENTIDAEVAAGSALSAVLTSYPKVIMAAVHGASIGWGCTQLSSFDLIYAHQSAFFQTPFASLGIVPEGGSSYNFPKAMGKVRANALLLAGERLSAHEAWVGGLITGVETDTADAFLGMVLEKAKRIGTFSGEALKMAKQLTVDASNDVEVRRQAGERESRDILIRFAAEDTKERMAAFSGGKAKSKI
ncbi:ClpP/crotonase [Setomelanomma holmii]|uniref:ClpP/crotonase n=1 Tax=Setomelanomma holmii TaxID=210430 RepID=A0A9P4GZ61_9PLEO|nr:ClpP/crotonase [Setomelanomma holmii]